MKLLLAICLGLMACTPVPQPEECKHKEEIRLPVEEVTPAPTSTNPFEHLTSPPIAATLPFVTPKMEYIGEFKLNDNANFHIWRDTANHVTCYFTDFTNAATLMSCVR